MAFRKFERSDAYSVIDLEGAAMVVGPVRSARKVLQRTTTDLVRHATYALAVHGIDGSGGAAALNLDPEADDGDDVIGTFVDELTTWAESCDFKATTGIGIERERLGELIGRPAPPTERELLAVSAVASMSPLDIGPVVIASDSEESELVTALELADEKDIERIDDLESALAAESRATFVRGSAGVLSHVTLRDTNAGQIIGLQPLTTTARGLAIAGRQNAVVVPDFVSAAAPYLAAVSDIIDPEALLADIAERTRSVAARWRDAGTTAFVVACEAAESHMRSWSEELPFGRPLAP